MKVKLSSLTTAGLLTLVLSVCGYFQLPFKQSNAQTNPNLAAPGLNLRNLVTEPNSVLQPTSPNPTVNEPLADRFSLQEALARVQQIRVALTSFRQLTEAERIVKSAKHNTDWETQNLGFPNWVGSVEGTLKQQHYQVKKLEFELAQKQYQDGEIPQSVLSQRTQAYQQAKLEFQRFAKADKIAD